VRYAAWLGRRDEARAVLAGLAPGSRRLAMIDAGPNELAWLERFVGDDIE
jgi:hypothetical protein